MICSVCGTTLELRFFPKKSWICPTCGYENDPDDITESDNDEA